LVLFIIFGDGAEAELNVLHFDFYFVVFRFDGFHGIF